jgi:ribosomal protein L40E
VTTFIVIGLGSWLLTAVTTILQRGFPDETIRNSLGGLEAFMLVIFAVTLENLFIEMVGFPGSIGQSLKKVNRWVWFVSLIAVAFLFYHTLINPRGELARALQSPNVQVTLGIAICFMVIAFGMHFATRRKVRPDVIPTVLYESPQAYHEIEEPMLPVQESTTIPIKRPIQTVPINLLVDEEKICPVCSSRIKSEARVCRFCRARFTITLRGYCLADHDVVDVTEGNRCATCNGEVVDLHVQSTLKTIPPSLPLQENQPSITPGITEAATGTQICPSCGQEIRVEARVCRFCRYKFD